MALGHLSNRSSRLVMSINSRLWLANGRCGSENCAGNFAVRWEGECFPSPHYTDRQFTGPVASSLLLRKLGQPFVADHQSVFHGDQSRGAARERKVVRNHNDSLTLRRELGEDFRHQIGVVLVEIASWLIG
jgi:hypothetical protein